MCFATLRTHKIFKRKKEKKESRRISGGFKRSQVFLKKYYPTVLMEWDRHRIIKRWIGNVRVEIFSKTRRAWTLLFETRTYLYFLFFIFFEDWYCCLALFGEVLMEMAIKHPQVPKKIIIAAVAEIIIFRGAQWRGCGNLTATLDRKRNVVPLFCWTK